MLRFETISATELDKYVYSKRAMIIDVRDEGDFRKLHIENAVNIPFERLEKNYAKMPKEYILILYCETGGRGLLAAKELYDRGYVVKAVIGGISAYGGKHLESGDT